MEKCGYLVNLGMEFWDYPPESVLTAFEADRIGSI